MFSASADLYDAIYGAFKHYAAESATVARLLRGANPHLGVRIMTAYSIVTSNIGLKPPGWYGVANGSHR